MVRKPNKPSPTLPRFHHLLRPQHEGDPVLPDDWVWNLQQVLDVAKARGFDPKDVSISLEGEDRDVESLAGYYWLNLTGTEQVPNPKFDQQMEDYHVKMKAYMESEAHQKDVKEREQQRVHLTRRREKLTQEIEKLNNELQALEQKP